MSWLNCEQHGKNQCQKKEHNEHGSVLKVVKSDSGLPKNIVLLPFKKN